MTRLPRPFVLVAVVLAACSTGNADAGEPPASAARAVEVASVESAPLAPPVIATGLIAGKEEIPLAFKVGGLISAVHAEEGQRVAAGQVLAELSQAEIGAMTTKALEARAKARRDLDRARALHADSVATLAQLQDATTALEVAEQDVRAAEFNRDLSVIRAPAAGVVLERRAEPGAMTGAGVAIVVLRTERRGVVLRAGLADRDAMRVRVGDRARITLDALPGQVLTGRVTQVAASASPKTGTFEVEVTLAGARSSLPSGLIAQAEIAVAASSTYPMLPLEALVEAGGDSAVVFVVAAQSDTAERRVVRLAQVGTWQVAVSSGIAAGERVVVRGGAFLLHGSRVAIGGGRTR